MSSSLASDVRAPNTPSARHFLVAACLSACLTWAYWPTIMELVAIWNSQPDYSHGYLIVPLALAFLWARRDRFPAGTQRPAILVGLSIVAGSIILRWVGARYYLGPIDGWSIILWIAGAVVAFFGWRVLWWSLPSIAFLFFMIPMPYRFERMFREPLQRMATELSRTVLVIVGQPAISEGNIIYIGDTQFGISEACAGLRIFVSILAIGYAYLVIVQRHWLIRILFFAMLLPVSMVVNCSRIVVTCLLYRHLSSEASRKLSHDIIGFAMIPLAAILLALVLWFLGHLFIEKKVPKHRIMFPLTINAPQQRTRNGGVDEDNELKP